MLETPPTISTPEPSELVKVSPYLMELLELGLPLAEVERQARGAERLKEATDDLRRAELAADSAAIATAIAQCKELSSRLAVFG